MKLIKLHRLEAFQESFRSSLNKRESMALLAADEDVLEALRSEVEQAAKAPLLRCDFFPHFFLNLFLPATDVGAPSTGSAFSTEMVAGVDECPVQILKRYSSTDVPPPPPLEHPLLFLTRSFSTNMCRYMAALDIEWWQRQRQRQQQQRRVASMCTPPSASG